MKVNKPKVFVEGGKKVVEEGVEGIVEGEEKVVEEKLSVATVEHDEVKRPRKNIRTKQKPKPMKNKTIFI